MTTYERILLRKKFKKLNPKKEILDDKKTTFTLDYVTWLENEYHHQKILNTV